MSTCCGVSDVATPIAMATLLLAPLAPHADNVSPRDQAFSDVLDEATWAHFFYIKSVNSHCVRRKQS